MFAQHDSLRLALAPGSESRNRRMAAFRGYVRDAELIKIMPALGSFRAILHVRFAAL
jgi:hypothetical protein